ncbi:MAG: hypothetical protein IJH20_05420 [Bacilli bacterium]|nr:hypothetical protein [Bacilli bacterium]
MKKSTYFAIGSLAALFASFVFGFITKNVDTLLLVSFLAAIVAFVLAIVSIVVAGKEKAPKAFPIVTLVVAILAILVSGLLFAFGKIIKNPENTKDICKELVKCKKDKDGVSICHIKGDDQKIIDIKCYDTVLTGDQYE